MLWKPQSWRLTGLCTRIKKRSCVVRRYRGDARMYHQRRKSPFFDTTGYDRGKKFGNQERRIKCCGRDGLTRTVVFRTYWRPWWSVPLLRANCRAVPAKSNLKLVYQDQKKKKNWFPRTPNLTEHHLTVLTNDQGKKKACTRNNNLRLRLPPLPLFIPLLPSLPSRPTNNL